MKEKLTFLNAAIVGVAIACGGGEADKAGTPPNGFTYNTDDYKYQIRVDIKEAFGDGDNFTTLFTNKKPSLTSQGGQSHLIAEDVYCPPESDNSWVDEAGCTAQFMDYYEISSPKRISVSSNQASE